MKYTFEDITGVIPSWRTARMTKGAVMNLKKWYPSLSEILIADDGSKHTRGDYNRAYGRDAYCAHERLDLDDSKLENILGTRYIKFEDHQGHGLTLDKILKYVKTSLMLTMDSDMRIVGEGLLEEYLEKYNEDPENIYAVGTRFSEHFNFWQDGKRQVWNCAWVNPCFSLWNMEPLRHYERLSFTNFVFPGIHLGTAAFLNWQLQHLDNCHADRDPYKPVIYPEPERIPQLWHLRKFRADGPESERAIKWKELMDG